MDIKQIGDLRDLRRRAMPGPVKPVQHPGYFGVEGVQVGPSIRCLGSKRAENQAFIIAAFNEFDHLLDIAKEWISGKVEAQPGNVESAWGFGGSWIDASKELPDAETTVLICIKDAGEPVWLGYHNGDEWKDVEGMVIEVTHWAEIPLAPGETVEGA